MTFEQTPKVRDLTQRSRSLSVEADGGSMYELLITVWLVFDREENHEGFELGTDWFDSVANSVPDDLREEIDFLGGEQCTAWCALRGLVAQAPAPHDIDSALAWLAQLDPAEIRRGLLGYSCDVPRDDGAVERAVGGDEEALGDVLGEKPELASYYRAVFALEDGRLRDRLVAALRRFREEVYRPFEAEFSQATAQAAAATTALARGGDPERVIETVTNGLDYRIQSGVSRLVLVPSVVLRPWAVIDRYQDLLMVAFPVGEEYINADPEAPPPWMVKIYKALADDKRLRILRRLAERPSSLDDLAEVLDLTKSTVHHHIGLLRSAGLVRVAVDPGSHSKHYALRPSALPGVWEGLHDYLNTPEDLQEARKR